MNFDFIEDPELKEKAINEYKESVAQKIAEEVDGLKNKNNELITEKRTFQEKYTALQEQIKDIDIDKAKKALELLKNTEKKELLEQGKLEDYIKAEVQGKISDAEKDFQTRLDIETTNKEKFEQAYIKYENLYKDKIMEDKLKEVAIKSGCLKDDGVISDMIARGKTIFSLNNSENDIEARDKDGNLMKTEDGEKILTPAVWAEQLKFTCRHYFPASVETGAAGATKGGSYSNDLQSKLEAAAASKDMKEFKRIKALMNKK